MVPIERFVLIASSLALGCKPRDILSHQRSNGAAVPQTRDLKEQRASISEPVPLAWTRPSVIRSRSGLAMATIEDTAVLFGGSTGKVTLGDTWIWTGSEWAEKLTPHAPSARAGHAMAGLGREVVLFGGFSAGETSGFDGSDGHELDDTWTWDGSDWTMRRVDVHPRLRSGHAMVSYAGKVLLFGGHGPDGFLSDTWQWNGHDWTKVETAGPPPRAAHGMARTTRGVLLFGGFGAEGVLDDTWTWDGVSWAKQSPSVSPSARGGHTLASLGDTTLLLGGASGSYFQDTWQWDGSTWNPTSRGAASQTCYGHATVALRGTILTFGGFVGKTGQAGAYHFCGTTTWDGVQLKPAAVRPSPSPREGHAMVSIRDRALLFGGAEVPRTDRSDNNETWEWNDGTWTQRVPRRSPGPRREHVMATLGQKVILFGGTTLYEDHDDTWEWDGEEWTARPVAMTPSKRHLHAMAALGNKVLLFGGRSGLTSLDDTWEWNGDSWMEKRVALRPPGGPQEMIGLEDRIILVVASPTSITRTSLWQWKAERWEQLPSPAPPPAREQPAVTALGDGLLMFGGRGCSSWECRDTWRWSKGVWLNYATNRDGPKGLASIAVIGNHAVLFDGTDTWTAFLEVDRK